MSKFAPSARLGDAWFLSLVVASQWSCGGAASQDNGTDVTASGGTNATGGSSAAVPTGGRVSGTGGATILGPGGTISKGGSTATAGKSSVLAGAPSTSAGSGGAIAGAAGAPVAGDGSLGGTVTAGAAGMAGTQPMAAAGSSGCSSTCGTPGCGSCPPDRSVSVDAPGGNYRIDATETTNLDYAAFLAINPSLSTQPVACSWNSSYVPPNDWPATGTESLPVAWVDWCDAYAYCKWANKRLCGAIGGGAVAYASSHDPNASQWYRACSNADTLIFPYGNVYDPTRCNGQDRVTSGAAALPVGSQPGCEGGVTGLFDMSGNLWEWEDSCATADGATDACRVRGGSFWSEETLLDCPTMTDNYHRASVYKNVGFRCCSDAQ